MTEWLGLLPPELEEQALRWIQSSSSLIIDGLLYMNQSAPEFFNIITRTDKHIGKKVQTGKRLRPDMAS